jgi:hypothetical protein
MTEKKFEEIPTKNIRLRGLCQRCRKEIWLEDEEEIEKPYHKECTITNLFLMMMGWWR